MPTRWNLTLHGVNKNHGGFHLDDPS